MPAAKKRKPTDATLRNVRASYRRDLVLTARVSKLEKLVSVLIDEVTALKMPQPFAAHQREMGYKHSTSAPHQIRVK